jgi:hypothetical protein
MNLLINSILKTELNQLLKQPNKMINDKTPLFYHLQKYIIIQSIQILFNPFLEYNDKFDIKKPNLNFILKLVHLFVKLISEKSMLKQEDIDLLVPILFPECLVNILFNLFLINPIHQTKSTILHIFSM